MTPPARTMCAFQRPPKDRSRVALRGRSWSSPGPERQQSLAPRRNPRGLRSWEAMGRSSAQRKFIRGLEQVAAICREVKAFESADAYGVTTKREVRASGQIEYTCFAVEREAPPDPWPLFLGAATHNPRGSLDHAGWAACKRPTRRTADPIFMDACEFQVNGLPTVGGLPSAVCTRSGEASSFTHS